jgi:hypothetical protein
VLAAGAGVLGALGATGSCFHGKSARAAPSTSPMPSSGSPAAHGRDGDSGSTPSASTALDCSKPHRQERMRPGTRRPQDGQSQPLFSELAISIVSKPGR